MFRSSIAITRALAVCASIASLPLAQQLITVGPAAGPGVDFTNLQAAVLAADPDATILVRAGDYDGFLASNRSLHIVAEVDAVVRIVSGVTIFGLDAQQSITLRGIEFGADADTAITIGSGAGSVWIEDSTIDVGARSLLGALVVHGCASVVLKNTQVVGPYHRPALRIFSNAGPTAVHAFDSTLVGGQGDPALIGAQDGAAAVEVNGAAFFAGGCTLTGGAGSHFIDPWFGCEQGAGGAGLALAAGPGPAQIGLLDTLVQGGSGADGCGSLPLHGPDMTGSGDVLPLPGAQRTLTANSPVREGQTLALSLAAPQGEFALLLLGAPAATATGILAWNTWNAPLLLSASASLFSLGFVPASGPLDLGITVGELGVEAVSVFAQPVFIDFPAGAARAGSTAGVALIDAAS